MKMLSKYKYALSGLVIAISALFLASCEDKESFDVEGSSDNIVFINNQSWSPINIKNGFLFNIEKTPLGNTLLNAEKIEGKFTIQCTQEAKEDIIVKFETDNSVIPDGYTKLPNGVVLKMDKSELVIKKGAKIANDSITISIDVASGQLENFDLGSCMAPVKIASVNSAKVSEFKSACLVIKTAYNNIKSATVPGGAVSNDKTGWIANVNGSSTNLIVDGVTTSTNYYAANSFPLDLEIDMGAVQSNILGLQVRYSNQNYSSVGKVEVYSSTTNSTDGYTLQGAVTLSRAQLQYVSFIGAIDARYIKLKIASPYSTSYGLRIQEFYIYQ